MTDCILPHYPVYIISKGRFNHCLTARCFVKYNVPFYLVVEPTEADLYAKEFGKERLLILPFHDLGLGGIPARNFVWEHAKATGIERHWILDDNIRSFFRRYRGVRTYCDPGIALRVAEDFTDRYENVGISGLNYYKFVPDHYERKPFITNCRVYSCILLLNSLPFQWRGRYNEDTDLCLQVLSTGEWCTMLLNTFLAEKQTTLKMKGGNTAALYQGDGRLRMARSLERMWPGVVETKRRYQRPQHVINWNKFDTPLKLKPGIDLSKLQPNEYGMSLVQVSEKIKSPRIQGLLNEWQSTHEMEGVTASDHT